MGIAHSSVPLINPMLPTRATVDIWKMKIQTISLMFCLVSVVLIVKNDESVIYFL